MNIHGAFPSDYLKAADMQGKAYTVIMGRVEMVKLDDGQKPVLNFQNAEKGLMLNKTNANTIAEVYGVETDAWFGQQIDIYPSETDFQGKRVPCIRVRRPSNPMPAAAPTAQQAVMTRQVEPQPALQQPATASAASDLDDEIPF